MRKILSILFLVSVCTIARAQNLTFSQVVTYSGQINYSSPTAGIVDGPIYTVPQGKVWKIESLNLYFSGTATNPEYMSYKINGVRIFCSRMTANTPFVFGVNFPIWLKSGDTIRPSYGYENSNNSWNANFPYFISIVEFNAP